MTIVKRKHIPTRVAALILVLVSFAVYAPAIPAPYMWDDLSLIAGNPTLDDHENIPRYFLEDLGRFNRDPRKMGFYRPFQALSFHLELALFGRNAPAQRAINVLWHAMASLALFLLARTLLQSDRWAFFAGLLFALHPLCTEQVCLIANRGGLAAGALALVTLALPARALSRDGPIHGRWAWAAGVAYTAALLFKPDPLPLVIPAAAWLILAQRKNQHPARTWLLCVGLLGSLAAAYGIWRWGFLNITHAHKAVSVPGGVSARFAAAPGITLKALWLALFPMGLRPIRTFDYGGSAWPVALAGAGVWLLLFVAAWKTRKKGPVFLFSAVFFAAMIAPYSGAVALVRPVAEHYYYLPTAAVCLVLAGLCERSVKGKWIVLPALLVLLFASGTLSRAAIWKSEGRLWSDNVRKEAGNSQALNNLGVTQVLEGRQEEAFESFTAAVAGDPGNIKARVNRVNAAVALGRYHEAAEELAIILRLVPCRPKALVQLGRLQVFFDNPQVRDLVATQREAHACAVLIDVGVASAHEDAGRNEKAARAYRRFLERAPSHPLAASIAQRLRKIDGPGAPRTSP